MSNEVVDKPATEVAGKTMAGKTLADETKLAKVFSQEGVESEDSAPVAE